MILILLASLVKIVDLHKFYAILEHITCSLTSYYVAQWNYCRVKYLAICSNYTIGSILVVWISYHMERNPCLQYEQLYNGVHLLAWILISVEFEINISLMS